MDHHFHCQPSVARHRLGLCRAKPRNFLRHHGGFGAAVRFGRRQLLVQYGQYQLFLSQSRKRHGHGLERRFGQLGRVHRAVCRAVGDYRGRVRRIGRRAANLDEGRRDQTNLAAKRRLYLGAVYRIVHHRRMVRHERYCRRQSQLQRASHYFQTKTQLDYVHSLFGHIRFVFGLCRRFCPADPKPVHRNRPREICFCRPVGERIGAACGRHLGGQNQKRRKSDPAGVHRHDSCRDWCPDVPAEQRAGR